MWRRLAALIACAALAGVLALPAPSGAAAGGLVASLVADACAAHKAELGKRAFRKRYGTRKTMRACVKQTRPEARRAVSEATDECLWELEEFGEEEFYFEWGTFSACVEDYAAWIMGGGSFEDGNDEDGGGDGEDGGL